VSRLSKEGSGDLKGRELKLNKKTAPQDKRKNEWLEMSEKTPRKKQMEIGR